MCGKQVMTIDHFPYLPEQGEKSAQYARQQAKQVVDGCHMFLAESGIAAHVELMKVMPRVRDPTSRGYCYLVYVVISNGREKIQSEILTADEDPEHPGKVASLISETLRKAVYGVKMRSITLRTS